MVSRPVRTVAALSLAAACTALLIAGSGCGVLFAPITVPAAIGSNHNYSLKGDIVDQNGEPLNEVLVHLENQHTYWEPISGQTTNDESKDVLRNATFDFPWVRGNSVSFNFTKPGYHERKITMGEDAYIMPSRFGDNWPTDQPAHVILIKDDRIYPRLRDGTVLLPTVTDQPQPLAFTLDAGAYLRSADAAIATPDTPVLLVTIQTQPLKTTGPDREVDPLDIGLPASITLRTNTPDAGFIRFVPRVGADPFEQMSPAPPNDVAWPNEFTLTADRLKALRKAGANAVVSGHEYFFFRFNGKYGKAALFWNDRNGDKQGELKLTIAIQPDGSRNLFSMESRH